MHLPKPKILIVGSIPPPFIGPSIATQNLLSAQNLRESFEVLFLDISDRRPPRNIGKLDFMNVYLALCHIGKFLRYLFLKKPGLVYFAVSQGLWGYIRDLGFFIPAVIFRKKIIVHLRGSEFDRFYAGLPHLLRLVTRKFFEKVTHVIVLGEKLKAVFKDLVKTEKIVVVPNGINCEEFALFRDLTLTKTKPERGVLYLSSLRERKGIFNFIDAIPFVCEKHPNTGFTIAGAWRDERERERANQSLRLNNLFERVHFTGEVSGITKIRLYGEHDIFVFPPIAPEGMPWVILEAMSAGLPVISTNQGAIPELVEDGRTGFIIDPTPEKLAEKTCFLIEHPDIARRMGEAGRRRVETHFSEETYLKKLEGVFRAAIT
jgi:glycosyltransferase involved in cell wall biosynthesis